MTVGVEADDNIIVSSAPIVNKFVGQPINNLITWMQKQKGFKYEQLN